MTGNSPYFKSLRRVELGIPTGFREELGFARLPGAFHQDMARLRARLAYWADARLRAHVMVVTKACYKRRKLRLRIATEGRCAQLFESYLEHVRALPDPRGVAL